MLPRLRQYPICKYQHFIRIFAYNLLLFAMKRALISLCCVLFSFSAYSVKANDSSTSEAAKPVTALTALAERARAFGERIPQEKVYVHMDNTNYFLGDADSCTISLEVTKNLDMPDEVAIFFANIPHKNVQLENWKNLVRKKIFFS